MFHPDNQSISGSLVLNAKDELAFFYGIALGFTPQWCSADIERGEIYIGGSEDNPGTAFKLGQIDETIYERVVQETQILLIEIAENDVRKPVVAVYVPLSVANQL